MMKRNSERGNIFFMLFGAVALVGVVAAATSTLMRGPLSTVVNVNARAKADTQMQIAAKLAMVRASQQAGSGDCDSDGNVEPIPATDASPKPIGGGQLPASIGASQQDPWGNAYGYCVWDIGTKNNDPTCATGAGEVARLKGDYNNNYPVMVIVSAGPDRTFQTQCHDWITASPGSDPNSNNYPTNYVGALAGQQTTASATDVIYKPNTSDDIMISFSYDQAAQVAGGLWSLTKVDPNAITTDKKLDIQKDANFASTANAKFQGAANFDAGSKLDLGFGGAGVDKGGLFFLPDQFALQTCNSANNGTLRLFKAANHNSLEVCDGLAATPAWVPPSSSGISVSKIDDLTDAVGGVPAHPNLFLGDSTGAMFTSASTGSNNVGVGINSFANLSAASIGNIAIGGNTGNVLTSGNKNILIGSQLEVPGAATSGYLSIGNMIFATGMNNTGTTASTGNVGIGTATPNVKLEVAGTVQGTQFQFNSSNALAMSGGDITLSYSGTNQLFVNGNGLGVGITPTHKLDVDGDAYASRFVSTFSSASNAPSFTFGGDINTGISHPAGSAIGFTLGGSEQARLTSTGLGIGTSTPTVPLDVVGAGVFTTSVTAGTAFQFGSSNGMYNQSGNISFNTSGVPRVYVTGSGLGVGLATPMVSIDAAGAIRPGTMVLCDATTHGAIRYGSGDALEYCSIDNAWYSLVASGGGGGAANLWTNNGTYISRANAAFINASQTLPAVLASAGTRFFWYPDKASFRAGGTSGAQWADTDIGVYSTGLGFDTQADGAYSFAAGHGTRAGGADSVAMGRDVIAIGANSFAFGLGASGITNPTVTGTNSFGIFMGNRANTTLAGNNTMALLGGKFLIDAAPGASPAISGALSLDVNGDVGAVQYCDSSGNYCFTPEALAGGSVGVFEFASVANVVRLNPVTVLNYSSTNFVFGSPQLADDGDATHRNRLYYYKTGGAFRVGGTSGTQWDTVGNYSNGLGYDTVATGNYSTAIGQKVSATGLNSVGFGLGAAAGAAPIVSGTGSYGVFMGDQSGVNFASGNTFGIFGGRMVIDPKNPATQLVARGVLDLGAATDAMVMPVGTTAQRPGATTSVNGMIRYNNDNGKFEAYQGGLWLDILTSGGGAVTAAGANNQIQFNSGGFLGASNGFTWDRTTDVLFISGKTNMGLATAVDGDLTVARMITVVPGPSGLSYMQVDNSSNSGSSNFFLKNSAASGRTWGFEVGGNNNAGGNGTQISEGNLRITNNGTTGFIIMGSSGNVGLGNFMPVTKLEVPGTIKISDGGEVCNSTYKGAIRYTSVNTLQYCNSIAWTSTANSGSNVLAIDDLSDAITQYASGGSMYLGSGVGVSATGAGNTALGYNAMATNVGAQQTTAFGYEANRYANSGGTAITYNTAVGYQALRGNTVSANNTGVRNTAIGHSALLNYTSAMDNTAIGQGAMYSNVANSGSTAVGASAMYYANSTTTGGYAANTALGYQALRGGVVASSNTGTNNTAVGTNSLLSMTTGNSNVALGSQAANSMTTGASNLAIGSYALYYNLGGNNNIAVGTNSLLNATGDANIGIGTAIGGTLTTGLRNVLIGNSVDVPAGATSDYINIGNLFKSDGTNAVSFISSNGAIMLPVGSLAQRPAAGVTVNGMIRYNNVSGKFEGYQGGTWQDILTGAIAGGAAAPDRGIQFNSGTSFYAVSNFTYTSAGRLGVGVANPTSTVGVGGGMAIGLTYSSGTPVASNNLAVEGTLGVGIINPTQGLLQVNNVNSAGATIVASRSSNAYQASTAYLPAGALSNTNPSWSSGLMPASSDYSVMSYNGAATSYSMVIGVSTPTNTLYMNSAGFVGIGTGSPVVKLDVNGTLKIADGGENCTTTYKGAIRYTSVNTLQYCTGTAWTSTAAGSGVMAIDDLTDAITKYSSSNMYLGQGVGAAATTGANNTAVGAGTLQGVVSGSNNVALGSNALFSNTTGGMNVAVGTNTLALSTTAGYNTAIGYQVLYGTSGTGNTGVGASALTTNSSGTNNTAVGSSALQQSTVATGNTVIGYAGMYSNIAKSENTVLGYYAMQNSDSSVTPAITYNTAVGAYALKGSVTPANNTGIRNTAIGHGALLNMTSGSNNTALGNNAGYTTSSGSFNVALGSSALQYNVSGGDNVAIGNTALNGTLGNGNIGIGSNTGSTLTTGGFNILLGHFADVPTATTSNYINIGNVFKSDGTNSVSFISSNGAIMLPVGLTGQRPGAGVTVNGMIRYNNSSGKFEGYQGGTWQDILTGGGGTTTINDLADAITQYSSAGTIYMGSASGVSGTGSGNTTLGYQAMQNVTTGGYNVAIGTQAMSTIVGNNYNVALGYQAMQRANSAGSGNGQNIAIGPFALQGSGTASANIGTSNVAVGYAALTGNSSGGGNVAMGSTALTANTTGNYNFAMGTASLSANTVGGSNIGIGNSTLTTNVGKSESVAIGQDAMKYADSAAGASISYNTAIGSYALRGSTTAANNTGLWNTAVGHSAALSMTSGSYNVALGANALNSIAGNSANTAIGANAMQYANNATTGSSWTINTAVGFAALQGSTTPANNTGIANTALGFTALNKVTSGSNNAGFGANAGSNITTGSNNMAFGPNAMSGNVTGSGNIAIGNASLPNTTGTGNTGIGDQVGATLTSGGSNVLIGQLADVPTATTSNYINIGNVFKSDGTNSVSFISSTGAIRVPYGLTASRPAAGVTVDGMMRYNTSSNNFEGYQNGAWLPFSSASTSATNAAGANTQMQFNSGGVLGASANYTYDLTNNIMTIANSGTGAIRAGAGTVLLPSHSFAGDTDTGLYNSVANILDIAAGGTRVAQFVSTSTGASVVFNGTSAVMLPAGTTLQQPSSSINGMMRYNSDKAAFEGFQNGAWVSFVSGSGGVASAAGSNTQVQFNSGGSLGAASTFTFNIGTGILNTSGGYQYGGVNALRLTTQGNPVVGNTAMSLSLSPYSVAVGKDALSSVTTEVSGVAVGSLALANNTVGTGVTAVGTNSLLSNVGAADNTAVGYNAMTYTNSVAAGTYAGNTALGSNALKGPNSAATNTGSKNTALGAYALSSNTTGSNNVVVGETAMLNNTTGSANIVLGVNSGSSLTTGSGNLLFGSSVNVPASNTSNYMSIGNLIFGSGGFGTGTSVGAGFIGIRTATPRVTFDINGTDAMMIPAGLTGNRPGATVAVNGMMRYNTSSANFEGYQNGSWLPFSSASASPVLAIDDLTDAITQYASSSMYLGMNSGTAVTSAVGNVTLGGLWAVTSGSYNVAVGGLLSNTTGTGNSSLGINSLTANLGGNYNTAVGTNALFTATGANNNAAVGNDAMHFATGGNNTAMGMSALYTATSGTDNIALGYAAGYNLTSGSSNIFIGSGINAQVATASNQMSIGNLIFASGGFGTGTTAGTGNVGIRTTSPRVTFDITGTDAMMIPAGLTANRPGSTVAVNGMMRYNTSTANFEGYQNGSWLPFSSASAGATSAASPDRGIQFNSGGLLNAVSTFTYTSAGRVGIGTASPTVLLEVNGASKFNGDIDVSGTGNINAASPSGQVNIQSYGGTVASFRNTYANFYQGVGVLMAGDVPSNGTYHISDLSTYTGTGTGTYYGIQIAPTLSTFTNSGTYYGLNVAVPAMGGTKYAAVFTGGNVGIGTITPTVSLAMTGTDAVLVPAGTLGQRPTGINGMIRYNSSSSNFEGYQNGSWLPFSSASVSATNAAGANTQVQFNSGGILGASSSFTYAIATSILGVTGSYQIGGVNALKLTSGGNPIVGNTAMTATLNPSSVGIGKDALAATNADTGSVAIGNQALKALTNGGANSAIGWNSQMTQTTGGYNTSVGGASMMAANGGSYNTAVGESSMRTMTTGAYNTAIGQASLYSTTTSAFNVAIGYNALAANVGLQSNTAVGAYAMQYADNNSANTYSGNTALGFQALQGSTTASNNTGAYNTAIGSNSMVVNTNGHDNTSVGEYSMFANTTGYDNAVLGTDGLSANINGYRNIAIGTYALSHITSGSSNMGIGYDVGSTLTTGSANILFGSAVTTPASNTSNYMTIGNLIFASGGFGTGTTVGTGWVGIKTATPRVTFDINGTDAMMIPAGLTANRPGSTVAVNGMMRYNTSTANFEGYQNGSWLPFSSASVSATNAAGANTQVQFNSGGILGASANYTWNNSTSVLSIQGKTNMGTTNSVDGDLTVANLVNVKSGTGGGASVVVESSTITGGASVNIKNTGASGKEFRLGVGGNNIAGTSGADVAEGNFTIAESTGLVGLSVAKTTGYLGFGSSNALAAIDMQGVTAALVPRGLTAQRPATGINGMIRYNASSANFEGYQNGSWLPFSSGASTAIAIDDLTDAITRYSSSNMYLGSGVGSLVTSVAIGNTVLGANALPTASSGSFNTGFGAYALNANTTGYENVAIGAGAMESNTTGYASVGIGSDAMSTGTGGPFNTAVGWGAMGKVTGAASVAVGAEALGNATAATANVAVGQTALKALTISSYNTAIGQEAMSSGDPGSNNTALGATAGKNATGTNNTYLGYGAATTQTTGNFNIAIGSGVTLASTTASNQLNIGNLITGDLTGTGITYISSRGAIKVPVGTTAERPSAGATQNGMIRYSSTFARFEGYQNGSWLPFSSSAAGSIGAIDDLTDAITQYSSGSMYIGQGAGTTASGANNFIAGYNAATSSTVAIRNVAIGTDAMSTNIGLSENVAIGYQAMQRTNSATGVGYGNNVAIGPYALQGGATPSLNIGTANTAIGGAALVLNTSGGQNNAIGYAALSKNTTGSNNVAQGNASMYNNTTGANNTAVGYQALGGNVANGESVAIGQNAMGNANSTATGIVTYNTAVGTNAMYGSGTPANNIGLYDTAIGHSALLAMTSASGNVAIGHAALTATTVGSQNVAIGRQAMQTNVGKGGNTAVGYNAMLFADSTATATLSNNTAVGMYAMMGSVTASANSGLNNTAIGTGSMQSMTSGSSNAALGHYSLNGVTTGGQNTGLGFYAGSNITTGSTNIIIGYNLDAQVATASNQLSIGNLIFGSGGFGTGTTVGTGRIGIKTASPRVSLDITGLDALMLPAGNNTTDRPTGSNLANGMIRYNATDTRFEGYQNGAWLPFSSGGSSGAVTAAGSNLQLQFNNGGVLGASANMTFSSATNALSVTGKVSVTDRISIAGTSALTTPPGLSLSNLSDVSLGALTTGYVLTYNGTSWAAAAASGGALAIDGLSDAVVSYTSGNMFLGTGVGTSATTAAQWNVSVGTGTMQGVLTGDNNAALGESAASALTSGYGNSAFGADALNVTTVGTENTAVGQNALSSNVGKSQSTAIGAYAMQRMNPTAATGSTYNVAVGFSAMQGSGTPASNTGVSNTAMGHGSMTGVTSGSNNTAYGNNSMLIITSGFSNSAFGTYALQGLGIGNYNAAFGNGALSSVTSGSSNIAVGQDAGSNITTGSGNIMFGSAISAPAAGTSNFMSIGNLIFASGGMGTGTTVGTGLLGIKTSTPRVTFDIVGTDAMMIPAGNNSTNRPAASAVANGMIRYNTTDTRFEGYQNGSWLPFSSSTGGGGTPAGATTQIQLNSAGSFGASSSLTYGTNLLSVTGAVSVTDRIKITPTGSLAAPTALALANLSDVSLGSLASGKVLTYNGTSWAAATPSAAVTPAGSTTQIQFNSGGSTLGASSSFTFNDTTKVLTVTGDINYTGVITDTSDRRLKTNIVPLEKQGRMLDKLDKLGTYSFTMKSDPSNRVEFGVMAQEMKDVFPELVKTDTSTPNNYMSVNYIGMIAPILQATKELKAENDNLKLQLVAMNSEQKDMKDTLASIQSDVKGMKAYTGYGIGRAGMDGWMMLMMGMIFGGGVAAFAYRSGSRRRQD